MRRIGFVLALVMNWYTIVPAQDGGILISESDRTIQEQIHRIYDVFRRAARDDLKTNCEAFDEIQRLKDMTNDKGEIVKQLAIFTAITESEEDAHVMLAGSILDFLDLPPSIPIRVLAPYLDADDRQLRDFARIWFQYHDSNTHIHGRPPLGSVNYYEYMQYVRSRFNKNEEIPAPFIEYMYEQQPGKALLVFAYASGSRDAAAQLQAMRKIFEARQQGKKIEPQEGAGQQWKEKRQARLRERSEILLAEHIISDAIWLKENGFDERFQKAMPEAENELAKLSKYDEWWARLYVAEMMRQYPVLRQPALMEQLRKDSHALVSKAAKSVKE